MSISATEKIKIGIAEDHPKLLATLKSALAIFEEVEVVLTATNGKELIDKLQRAVRLPEVILMDIEMPIQDGIKTTTEVKTLFPEIIIVMLTVFDASEKVFQAIMAGASGYLLKGEKTSKVVQGVINAKEGRLPMSPEIAGNVLQLMRSLPAQNNTPQDFDLTKREVEILEKLSQAWSYQKIADKLFISTSTVRNHIHKIYQKIHVGSKAEAVQFVLKQQWFR